LPSARCLGRLLGLSHGITGAAWAGPTPSAGGLQALELYLIVVETDWLPAGYYHYDRAGHCLAQLATLASRADVERCFPSLYQFEGGALLWVLVGDGARVRAKYGDRGLRFLLLEAGHLMQNLCLVSAGLGLATVPLGGFFERDLARRLSLLDSDLVLYTGICGGVKPP
jgi:SagB-type dehydrogenase family enzyme